MSALDQTENKEGLEIDRIFERGEVLAILRAIAAVIHKPSRANPKVTQLRYNLFGDDRFGLTDPVASHSMSNLQSASRTSPPESRRPDVWLPRAI